MPSVPSSRTSSASSPRGQLAKKASERLEDNEEDRGEQDERGKLVEPPVPGMAVGVAIGGEIGAQLAAPQVVRDEQRREPHLGMDPARAAEPAEPKPQSEHDGENAPGGHDSPVE